MISYLLPERAATVQQLGHPSAGVIGFEPAGQNTSGQPVTENIALNYSAVWAATRVLSETVASLPCILYQREGDGKARATEDPRFTLVHDQPNEEQGAYSFFEAGTANLVNWGNNYAKIGRAGMNSPLSLELRLPETVHVDRRDDGVIEYEITDPSEVIEWPDMLHTIGLSRDGLVGQSVVRRARQSIGTAIAMDKHKGSFFGNSATPRGAIVHPERLKKEQREEFRRQWNEMHQGSENANNIAVLHGGITYQQLGMSHEDAQFLESMQFSVQEISRWYRLPPHFLGDLTRATFSNIEQQGIEFVVYSLTPWLRRWETALNQKLLRRSERPNLFFEFLVDALLRGDVESRFKAYSSARQWGWMSVNEIRKRENMNEIENGDIYLQPANMAPAGVATTQVEEFQTNMARSIDTIKQLAVDMREGQQDAATVDDVLGKALSGLRDEREQLKKELNNGHVTQVAVSNAAREMFRDRIDYSTRIVGGEAVKAARRQVHKNDSFLKWLDEYHGQHVEAMQTAIARTVMSLQSLKLTRCDAEKIAEAHWEACLHRLMDCANEPAETFEAAVSDCVSAWQPDILEAVESLLESEPCDTKN